MDDFLLDNVRRRPQSAIQPAATPVTPAGEKLETFLTVAIAELKGEAVKGAPMKEKIAALREFRTQQRKILDAKIDATKEKAKQVYSRAHAAADREFDEVREMDAELDLLDDEVNQLIGGNSPPK
jgi:hypothetical protein